MKKSCLAVASIAHCYISVKRSSTDQGGPTASCWHTVILPALVYFLDLSKVLSLSAIFWLTILVHFDLHRSW